MERKRFEIEKGVPMPKVSHKGRNSVYPFREMEVGDCLKFAAKETADPEYRKIYNSAKSHVRRSSPDYDFRFARIDGNTFGCWKVRAGDAREGVKVRRRRRTAAEIESIPAEAVRNALASEGTFAGAARIVGVSPRTLVRLISKLGIR